MISGSVFSIEIYKQKPLYTLFFAFLNREMAVMMGTGGNCNEMEFANTIKAVIIVLFGTIQLM